MIGWGILVMIPVEFAGIMFGGWVAAKLEWSGHKVGSWIFITLWTLVVMSTCVFLGSRGSS